MLAIADMSPWVADLMRVLQSPLYLWAVFALIIVPGAFLVYAPRLIGVWAGGARGSMESARLHSRVGDTVQTLLQFIVASSAQAVIGAVVLLLLRYAGINLL